MKFKGFVTKDNDCVMVNLDAITFLDTTSGILYMNGNRLIRLNNNSVKYLLEILEEMEYELQSEVE